MTTMTTMPTRRAAVPEEFDTLIDVFAATVRTHGTRPALRWHDGDDWQAMTWAAYGAAVAGLADALAEMGLARGDRVGILSSNRPEWHIADLATLAAGFVTVPVYPTSSATQVAYVLAHSGCRICFVADAEQAAKVLLRRRDLPELERLIVMGDATGLDDGFVASMAELVGRPGDEATLAQRAGALSAPDLATLVYTSGTTGPPKGAMISHANVMATMRSLTTLIDLHPDDRFLSFLPLSHITERSISDFGQIVSGAETWFARSLATLAEDLRACRPTILFAVPRLWEKFHDGILEQVESSRPPARQLAESYLASAARPAAERTTMQRARHWALDQIVGRPIRRKLGVDRARVIACGAAPIHPDLLRWFAGIGVPIAEGYGQTEVTLCTSLNTPDDIVIGTVGRPLPGVEVAIADDDEILVRGDNVCAGYWRDEVASAELIDADGWLHTGDLGCIDRSGRVQVTGRKKDLIISAYGKNISPSEIETALRLDPLISQAVVVGDGRPYLVALLTLDGVAVAEWARQQGRDPEVLSDLADDAQLRAAIDLAVERVNSTHSHPEAIRRWRALPHELTMAAGELTPTLKVKRNVVTARWADLIEEMYARH